MRYRHLLYVGLALPILIAAGQQGQPPKPAPAPKPEQPPSKIESMSRTMEDPIFRDTLATQEKKMWEDVKSQNWAGFESALSDQFMGICPQGIQNKAQVLTDIKKGKVNSYTLGDWHAVKVSETSGVVLYRVEADMVAPNGKADKGTYYCSTTWTKRDGKWVADTHQSTEHEGGALDK